MARVIRMPGLAANDTSAVLAAWVAGVDAVVADGDVLATVETDKAAVEVEAPGAGTVLARLVPEGAEVEVGAPIAVLAEPGEEVPDLDALLAELGVTGHREPGAPGARADGRADGGAPSGERREGGRPRRPDGRVYSSPLARAVAAGAGLSVEEVPGTGPRQRVLRRDVERAIAARGAGTDGAPGRAPGAPSPGATPPPSGQVGYEDVPHSRIRRATAARLAESKREAPHFYLRATVRAERLLDLRAELNAESTAGGGPRVSVNDLVVKAVGAAHRAVPEMNVVWTPDAVRQFTRVDVAVAVATERGLVTPVVRDVPGLTLGGLVAQVRDLASRAHAGRLRPEELEGGSITVTNLGMHGVEEFAAIINPPQSAILAVGAVREEPVVEHGVVVAGRVLRLTLAVDHRPLDGVLAARWLDTLVGLLEHPVRALV